MQNSRNAREAELPAELPQVPLMLPNRRHGHQSSPSCLQKSTEPPQSSPDMPPMAEWQQPPPPSPGDWRGMRIIVVQLTWASARRNRRAAGRATPVTRYAARFACAATTNPHSACKFARAAQSSPDMPPNDRTAAAAAPESWRLARHVRDCGSTALACAKAMAHRIGDHLHPSIPTLWAGPRNTPRDLAFATGTDTKANTVTKFTQHRQLATTAASM